MVTWREFALARPDLAEVGEKLLNQFGIGLGFLATVRRDGGPRVHPVCPIIAEHGLYVFVEAGSPKKDDLLRDGRYALHSYPVPRTDESFYCTGRVRHVSDPNHRAAVLAAAQHQVQDTEVLFEFEIEHALHTVWENWGTPEMRPRHTKWRAAKS